MRETRVRSLGWEEPLGEGNGNPLQYSCLENPMDRQRSLVCYSPWDCKVGHEWATSLSLWRWFHLFFIILQYLVFFFFCMRPTCFHAHRWINTFIWHQDPHFIYSQSKLHGSCWGQWHDTSPTWKQALLTQYERSLHNLMADAGKGLLSDFQTLNNRI